MKFRRNLFQINFNQLPWLICVAALLLPSAPAPAAQTVQLVLEVPQLHPAYSGCATSAWYQFTDNRGYPAYLTLNVSDPGDSTNYGEWHPLIPQDGYYRVEAYIPQHGPISWCSSGNIKAHDTTEAHYTVHHANGVTPRSLSQTPLSNQWLDIGEYYFKAGTAGYVSLSDLNQELAFSTTVSFSAMRFTFTRLTRPNTYLPLVSHEDPTIQLPPSVGILKDQGFDACHLPTVAEMQTWWNKSPYRFYGLYIGGIHLPSMCGGVNAAWVQAVHQQGWGFVPTWVGPQAPCTDYHYRMSNDPAVSYQQGRQEANAASTAAAVLGLSNTNGGTIIYYDLEAYGVSTSACRQPVAAFINGWTGRLHELGNLAGGYGTRNSYPQDWAAVPNVPDSIWGASWYADTYDPYASVLDISWLAGLWTNHQRIRQYAGDHGETWGGVRFALDSNVADGLLAMPSKPTLNSPKGLTLAAIEDTGWLSAEQGWVVLGRQLYLTNDQGKTWRDISPAAVRKAVVLGSGEAWALGTQEEAAIQLYHSTEWGASWTQKELPLPAGEWQPIQIQFVSSTQGWVVLQKVTSQAFDIGILIKTGDGGLSWQNSNLPGAEPIQFASQDEAWMTGRDTSQAYKSMDGGLTWEPAKNSPILPGQKSLPDGSSLSGWQADGLGWSVGLSGSCTGEKSSPDFTCIAENSLRQSPDGGQTWIVVPLPTQATPVP